MRYKKRIKDMHPYPRQIIEDVIEALGRSTEKLLKRQKEYLIHKNEELGGHSNGFLLGGHYFTKLEDQVKIHTAIKKPLHQSLYPEGLELLQGTKELEQDMQQLTQGLSVVLFDCRTRQDIRNALPDTVMYLLPNIFSVSRTKDEAWTLRDKPLQMMGYPKTAKLLNIYSAMRILE